MKVIVFSAVFFLSLLCAVNVAADDSELLVMVDTSASMFLFFDDLVDYLIKDLLKDNLQDDDYFHLLSFADEPQVEIATVIDDDNSLRRAVSAILLLHPLGRYTDLIRAVQFLYDYTSSLPEDSTKSIFLLTDGIHDPPPGSPFYNWDEKRLRSELLKNATEIKKQGWSVHIIHLPGDAGDAAQTGERKGTDLFPDLAAALETPPIPFTREDQQTSPSLAEPPPGQEPGPEPPLPSEPAVRYRFIIYILYTLLALLLAYFLIRFIMFLSGNIRIPPLFIPGLYISESHIKGSDLLIMHVYYHEWLMHKHSIKSVAPGVFRSVGGKGSAFSIQVIDLPRNIALIRNDGGHFIFQVKKEEYFPDLVDPLADCLNKKIEAVSLKGQKVVLIFERYISPLEEINNIMRSIRIS
jgi:hypothetical protein